MRILILGAGGMLGNATASVARQRGLDCEAANREQLDLTDSEAIERHLDSGVQAVINCAAFTDVDGCETQEDLAMEINGYAVGRLAALAAKHGVPLVQVSTDYVFSDALTSPSSDAGNRPYPEDHPVAPASAYGRSKAVGERLALASGGLVVRTSWLFGPGGGSNFVIAMLRQGGQAKPVKVVEDQIGCPTYTVDLAGVLLDLLAWSQTRSAEGGPRIFHMANSPAVSWFGFARGIFEVFERTVDLAPCTTAEFPRPAPRPAYSVLSTERLRTTLGVTPRGWRAALLDYRAVLESDRVVDTSSPSSSNQGEPACES